jgi:hypothetical protein
MLIPNLHEMVIRNASGMNRSSDEKSSGLSSHHQAGLRRSPGGKGSEGGFQNGLGRLALRD